MEYAHCSVCKFSKRLVSCTRESTVGRSGLPPFVCLFVCLFHSVLLTMLNISLYQANKASVPLAGDRNEFSISNSYRKCSLITCTSKSLERRGRGLIFWNLSKCIALILWLHWWSHNDGWTTLKGNYQQKNRQQGFQNLNVNQNNFKKTKTKNSLSRPMFYLWNTTALLCTSKLVEH